MAEFDPLIRFLNPERDVKPQISSSRSLCVRARPRARPRASPRQTTTSFFCYQRLPAELRSEIIKNFIHGTLQCRNIWFEKQGNPIVVQSRRGILHSQLQDKQPPSLARFACVNTEWRVEVEKQLFQHIDLWVVPDSGPNEYADVIDFSAIVTGPRRRYLKVLRLESYRQYPTYQQPGSYNDRPYRIGGSYECILRLLRILGTWASGEATNNLLIVDIDIELQDFPLQHLRQAIEQLPKIECIGALYFTMETETFSKVPLALLSLLRKLPLLRAAHLRLSPWCFSNDDDRDRHLTELMRGFRTETPQLVELEMTQPFLGTQMQISNGLIVGILTGPSIASMRHTSYHLRRLVLGGPLDLPLFFETFHDAPHGSLVPRAQHAWPRLEVLIFRGPIVRERAPVRYPLKDEFLKLMGRAAGEMPRLTCAVIMVESQLEFGIEGVGMSIGFTAPPDVSRDLSMVNSEGRDTGRPALTVALHTPSRSAVRVWREAIQHTKHMSMVVEFKPLPNLDEDGKLVPLPWQEWKD